MKTLKSLTFIFLALALIVLSSITTNLPPLANAGFVQNLANDTGGTVADILGGFGCIFGFLSLTFGLIVFLKRKQHAFLFCSIGAVVMIGITFFCAFGKVV